MNLHQKPMRTSRTLGVVLSAAIIALLTLSATAYKTQKGYVKTRGRYTSQGTLVPGKPLSNAVVMIRNSNSTRSDAKGNFSVTLPEQSFYLQNVKKEGYILSDPDVLKRRYSCSATPLVLVLETPQQQADDRLASEKKLRRTLQRKLQAKEDELEALKEENKITTEEYRNALQELYKLQETNEKFISKMAERYSRIDFDELDDFQRQIAAYIQDGELARADSLLNTKGSMDDREAEINRLREANTQRREEIAKEQQDLEASEDLAATKLADFGADCYNRFQISRLELKNDSAAYWLERRANADTTNIDWQLDAGLFLSDYLADYDKALRFYHIALNLAEKAKDYRSWGVSLNNIGVVYGIIGNYKASLENHEQALIIQLLNLGEYHPDVAASYNNLGCVYMDTGRYDTAMENYEKALQIKLNIFGDKHPDVAISYLNIGSLFYYERKYTAASEYYEKALKIYLYFWGEENPLVATTYNNIGLLYLQKGEYDTSLENFEKAKDIMINVYGENHPDVAGSYNNIGGLFYSKEDYPAALENHKKSLSILLDIFGNKHPYVAISYSNIGDIYDLQGDFYHSIESYKKAQKIWLSVFEETNENVVTSYANIGLAYSHLGNYDAAIENLRTGLKLQLSISGESNSNVATFYNHIANVYFNKQEYDKALTYYEKALGVWESIYGKNHPYVIMSYYSIGNTYSYLGNFSAVFENYDRILYTQIDNQIESDPDVLNAFNSVVNACIDLGGFYLNFGNWSNGVKFLEKALKTSIEIFGENHPYTIAAKENIEQVKNITAGEPSYE